MGRPLFKHAFSPALLPGLRGVTVGDLTQEVQRDPSLAGSERQQALANLRAATRGAPPSTPVSSLAAGVGGGIVANLAGKYFGMSTVGRTLLTAVGFGLGQQINDRLGGAKPAKTYGWRV